MERQGTRRGLRFARLWAGCRSCGRSTLIRPKSEDRVREDALAQAKRKLEAGCPGCTQGYASLAMRHGPTRRDFLRAGLASLAAIPVAAGLTAVLPKTAGAHGVIALGSAGPSGSLSKRAA